MPENRCTNCRTGGLKCTYVESRVASLIMMSFSVPVADFNLEARLEQTVRIHALQHECT